MIEFPLNPTVGQEYTQDGKSWKWNSFAWDLVPVTSVQVAAAQAAAATAVTKAAEVTTAATTATTKAAEAVTSANTALTQANRAQSYADQMATGQVNADWTATSGKALIMNKPTIPTNTNQLTNGAAFITSSALPTKVSQLTNDSGYITAAQVPAQGVTSVNTRTGAVTLTSADVGLGNVENKSGATIRSEMTATEIALSLGYRPILMGKGLNQLGNDVKIGWLTGTRLGLMVDDTDFSSNWPINVTGSANQLGGYNSQYHLSLANSTGILTLAKGGTGATTAAAARTALELGNVNNTTDLAKPVSTATQTALDAKAGINGDTAKDFNVSMLYASGAVVANGTNTMRMFGAATTVAPGITAEGADANIGLFYGTKGSGYHMFVTGANHHFTVGGNSGVVVNRLRIYGGLTGQNAVIVAEGGDTNVGLDFNAKGRGEYIYRSGGGIQLVIGNDVNPVNYMRIVGGVAGTAPNFNAQGADTNIDIAMQPKGSGSFVVQPNGVAQFKVAYAAGAVNMLQTYGATAGNRPTLEAIGTSTNIGMALNSKGTGDVLLATGGRAAFVAEGVANSVNHISVAPSITGIAAVIKSQGGDANIGMRLQPKGTGSVFVDAHVNLLPQAGYTERRLSFNTTNNVHYFYARDSDGVIGLYDLSGSVSPWFYTPATKILNLGADKIVAGNGGYTGNAKMYIEGAFQVNNTIWGNGAVHALWGSDGQVSIASQDSNGSIELGKAGRLSAGTPYIDFHSSVGSGDFDARIIVDGGTMSTMGQATMTLIASKVVMNTTLQGAIQRGNRLGFTDLGSSGTAVKYIDASASNYYRLQISGAGSITLQNFNSADSSITLLELVSGATFPFTWTSTINWVKADGSGVTTTNFNEAGYTLKTVGTDWILLWGRNNAVWGKVMR